MARQKITIKSREEIAVMREGGKILASVLAVLAGKTKAGIYGDELERTAAEEIKKYGATPSFKGYRMFKGGNPFPACICLSVNDEIVHGFPFGKLIKDGDLVGIDLGVKYKGFHTDSALTVAVGNLSPAADKLLKVTRDSLYEGIKEVKAGNRTGDIGFAIQTFVERNGFSVVRDLVGHGVGRSIHEPPEVPNFAFRGNGIKLCAGMTFAIEPMINEGSFEIKCDPDQWTIRTRDGGLSAHFEHTVAVTEEGCEILTK